MLSRRSVLKGGGVAVGGLAAATLASGRGVAAATPAVASPVSSNEVTVAGPAVSGWWRQGGTGPLYWTSYGYSETTNSQIPESVWKANVDWVAGTFATHGYNMVCTDGWIDGTQKVTSHGYIRSLSDDWAHDWQWWVRYLHDRGMTLGVYYNPLWVTRSAIEDPTVRVAGRPDVRVADIVDTGNLFDTGDISWIDVDRDGAEEYVKGYVDYFAQMGVAFLRIDFLSWYETGFDQSEGTVCTAHGRESYLRALQWMREAAGPMKLSFVMPNLFDHAAGERLYGDLVRIDNDASFGTWYNLSGGSQTWQPIWSQWNNPFLGFTGFSDVSGRGQLTLDGDPLILRSFASDTERQTAVSLFTMAGAPIAIADRYDNIEDAAPFYLNEEVLAVRRAGLVGKPIYQNSHGFFYDTQSRDPERWTGQLSDGSWVVGLFNRDDGPGTSSRSVDFSSELGIDGPAAMRDLWAHRDLGSATTWSVALAPHACSLVKVVPVGPARYQAEVGAWTGGARFDNVYAGHSATGYVTGLDGPGSSVAVAVSRARAGSCRLVCRAANATGGEASLTVKALNPLTGRAHGSARLVVDASPQWTDWREVPVTVGMAAGENLVVLSHEADDRAAVNLDALWPAGG
jgi:glucan 1,6-alpha-isomaltosidase